MTRFVESAALIKSSTVNSAVAAVQNEGAILAAARGGSIGIDGEIATVPTENPPEIDPETGEFDEPAVPPDWFRAGAVCGVAPVRPGTRRGE